ncbi:uncharacterized protein CLUP02_01133 [Colletotrichum lupini]|uniref:Uncharacterized protein n=1 Tax=Colletotrichum lupini TaxID=145971 RepID=A0A9Q8W9E7_9PEZI|nr:uncharacterized protein CLUP02_01133 [Colletotrichum lupini]UQC74482.1 hypothetical protein CLUP02_01133 [Colletotrichum lupini]
MAVTTRRIWATTEDVLHTSRAARLSQYLGPLTLCLRTHFSSYPLLYAYEFDSRRKIGILACWMAEAVYQLRRYKVFTTFTG